MAFDRRFMYICPPITETVCRGPFAPLLVEEPTQPIIPSGFPIIHSLHRLRDAFVARVRGRVQGAAVRLYPLIRDVYGFGIKSTMIEPSSSIIVRSENHYNERADERIALRIHMYELLQDACGYAKCYRLFEASCDQRDENQLTETEREQDGLETPTFNDAKKFYQPSLEKNSTMNLSPNDVANLLTAFTHGPLGIHPLSESDRFGQYLGFIDLRPWFGTTSTIQGPNSRSPLALGLLVPPRRYRMDPRAYLIVGDYSPIFGGPPFASTVYCQQDDDTGGAVCAQAALVMALGLLSDRGARVEGSYGLTYLAFSRDRRTVALPLPHPQQATCLAHQLDDSDVDGCFLVNGLRPTTCEMIVSPITDNRDSAYDFRVSPKLVELPSERYNQVRETFEQIKKRRSQPCENFADRLATRLIQAYISARFPVVLYVNVNEWWSEILTPGTRIDEDKAGHAVTVIGFRRWGPDSFMVDSSGRMDSVGESGECEITVPTRNVSLVTHDPGYRPFFERPLDEALTAAWGFRRDKTKPILRFLGVADRRIHTHPSDCLDYLCGYDADWRRISIEDLDLSHDARDQVNDEEQQLHVTLFAPYRQMQSIFRIRLIHAEDLASVLGDEIPADSRAAFASKTFKIEEGRYWCVLGYGQANRRLEIHHIWFFAADRLPASGFDATVAQLAPHPYRFDSLDRRWHMPSNAGRIVPWSSTARTVNKEKKSDRTALAASVITSSSPQALHYLINEVRGLNRISRFDLYVFREVDLLAIERWLGVQQPELAQRMVACDQHCFSASGSLLYHPRRTGEDRIALRSLLVNWLESQTPNAQAPDKSVEFPAIATFFPDITHLSTLQREAAREALVETILLGHALQKSAAQLVRRIVVEIVCGTRVDRCSCSDCAANKRCFVGTQERKNTLLVASLVAIVEKALTEQPDLKFTLALELEPGESYVLYNLDTLATIFELIHSQMVTTPKGDRVPLSAWVGLNVDIAHMMSAGISAQELRNLNIKFGKNIIVHAHISDLPGMHARDQVPVSWTMPDTGSSPDCVVDYQPYVELLQEATAISSVHGLLYTGVCALELEGCGRIDWIHRGLCWMQRLFML